MRSESCRVVFHFHYANDRELTLLTPIRQHGVYGTCPWGLPTGHRSRGHVFLGACRSLSLIIAESDRRSLDANQSDEEGKRYYAGMGQDEPGKSVALDSSMAPTKSNGSLFISTMSALSIATSVPAPIAKPTSAWIKAGASFKHQS